MRVIFILSTEYLNTQQREHMTHLCCIFSLSLCNLSGSFKERDASISGGHRMFGDCLFCVITVWITVQFLFFLGGGVHATSAASSWRKTCLMYGVDIKRSQWAWEKVNHCSRNEVKRIRPVWRRNWEKRGRGSDNTIMMKAVGFHFILSSHVRMNLQNDIRGQLEYEQFVCAQTVLAVCEGKPCPYTFIPSDECLMPIPLPYLQLSEEGKSLSCERTYTLSSPLINNQMAKDLCWLKERIVLCPRMNA